MHGASLLKSAAPAFPASTAIESHLIEEPRASCVIITTAAGHATSDKRRKMHKPPTEDDICCLKSTMMRETIHARGASCNQVMSQPRSCRPRSKSASACVARARNPNLFPADSEPQCLCTVLNESGQPRADDSTTEHEQHRVNSVHW